MIQKIYKCKLCHKIIYEECGTISYLSANIKMQNDVRYTENRIHCCDENRIGILSFLGIKKLNYETKIQTKKLS